MDSKTGSTTPMIRLDKSTPDGEAWWRPEPPSRFGAWEFLVFGLVAGFMITGTVLEWLIT
ncbi:MAG: hypothetical protein ABW003_30385 [Microvirga sp.]